MITPLIQILAAFGLPLLFIWLSQQERLPQWLSPVILAYVSGIMLANIPGFSLSNSLSSTLTDLTVPLAIPLLLFNTDLLAWLRHSRPVILSFALCLLAVSLSSVLAALAFADRVEGVATASGMLVGVYTGGSPNLAAIGKALEAPEEMFILLNASEILCGGIYFIFLTTVAQRLLLFFLPPFRRRREDEMPESGGLTSGSLFQKHNLTQMLLSFGLAVLAFGASVGFSFLVMGEIDLITVLISLSTLSILFSLSPRVRELQGSYDLGQYLILVFSVAIGMLTDFGALLQSTPLLLVYTAFVTVGAISLHYLFASLFRIDADTVLITSTAAIFGPAFVGQVAIALRNKEMVLSGIITGLVGYAVGNYLGIFIAYLVSRWIV